MRQAPCLSIKINLLSLSINCYPPLIHQDKSPLTKKLMLRSTLQEAGINVTYYSGHSFRIGAATTAAACGISETIIMQMGHWRSSAYQAYIKIPTRDLATISHKIPYSGKFLRGPIFVVFAVDWQTTKIKPTK